MQPLADRKPCAARMVRVGAAAIPFVIRFGIDASGNIHSFVMVESAWLSTICAVQQLWP